MNMSAGWMDAIVPARLISFTLTHCMSREVAWASEQARRMQHTPNQIAMLPCQAGHLVISSRVCVLGLWFQHCSWLWRLSNSPDLDSAVQGCAQQVVLQACTCADVSFMQFALSCLFARLPPWRCRQHSKESSLPGGFDAYMPMSWKTCADPQSGFSSSVMHVSTSLPELLQTHLPEQHVSHCAAVDSRQRLGACPRAHVPNLHSPFSVWVGVSSVATCAP